MPTKLSEKATEGSTFAIKADFIERTEGGDLPFTPKTGLSWSLKDKDGKIINNKLDVVLVPAPSVDIVLSGNDLALLGNHPVRRYVTIRGTYDSVFGNDLPLIDEVSFQIKNLVGVRAHVLDSVSISINPVVGTPSIGVI